MIRHLHHVHRRWATPLLTAALLGCEPGDDASTDRLLIRAAVAANFAAAHRELAEEFEALTGVRVETSLGATGVLYAQIVNGAPFDVLLAADTVRPARLEAEGLAVPGSRFTYAAGRLALFAPSWDSVSPELLRAGAGSIRHVAIANTRTAPYGSAAQAVLQRWGLWDGLQDRIVRGENVGQAFQFVASGAAEVGFVALAQLSDRDPGTYWVVERELHPPLHQDAVLLPRAAHNTSARRFLEFLRSEEALEIMATFGYEPP